MSHYKDSARPDWAALLIDAVTRPGVISTAYTAFWNYSIGNQFLALWECALRKLDPGPINTFKGWQSLGRQVRNGEQAITLCMPVTWQKQIDPQKDSQSDDEPVEPRGVVIRRRFIFRARWFVLSQTDGADYVPASIPEWDEARALSELRIERVPFKHLDGNCQGYAIERSGAVSPIAIRPTKTLIHEIAHVVLDHTAEHGELVDTDRLSRNVQEVEAESVALICLESLGLSGSEDCRGYIQHWLGHATIDDASAHRIFRAADVILRAGRPATLTLPRS